jgi:hypothetical protein
MQIVKSSFLPKLSANGKEYSKMGHKLEVPFAKRLLEHSMMGLSKIKVEEIYRVGLVGKEDAKASCDFIAVATVEHVKVLVGVECKAWVTPGTHQRERGHADFLSRFQHSLSLSTSTSSSTSTTTLGNTSNPCSNTELYTVIDAQSTNFHLYVDLSHEAKQILHQAYVCDFSYVMLLVGDSSGNIIRGKKK